MQKQPIRKCQKLSRAYLNCSVFKKILIGILIISLLICGCVLWYAYKSKRPPIVYEGADLFSQETYLKYEKGEQLKAYIDDTLEYLNDRTVTDFRYYDFKKRDVIWGKYTDYYLVDYTLETDYNELVDYIQSNSNYSNPYKSWTMFQMNSTVGTGFYLFTNEHLHKIRVLYITDFNSWNIMRFLSLNTDDSEWI